MGWWGCGVMEGDGPMDMEAVIIEHLAGIGETDCKTDAQYDRIIARQRRLAVKKMKAGRYHDVIRLAKDGDEMFYGEESNIILQVLGEMIMCYGGRMSERTKGVFRQAARNDEWAQESDERKAEMTAYINRITNYKGKKITPTSQGLFSKIFQALDEGKVGLINKMAT